MQTLAEQLKTQTLANHQQLEKMLVLRMRAIRNVADYITLLNLFYSYFGALEEKITSFIGDGALPDHASRRKTESLAADIVSLGGTLPKKAGPNHIPLINNTAAAFGALYVIEGSTLGGQIISQMINKHLALDHGFSFFNGYGAETNAMWEDFKQVLNNRPENPEDIISAANNAFEKFKLWVEGF